MHPASLVTRPGEDLVQSLPEAERAVADGDLGRDGEAAGFQVDQELAPALRALSYPDMEAEELLLSLRRGADDDEDALRLGLHPGLEVDAVGPDVDVPAGREVTALPALVFLLPLGREARNHARRQIGRVGTEDRGQRLLEIAGGDAAQVENGQEGVETPRAAGPLRQDVRGEPDLILAFGSRSAVPDLRAPNLEGADPGLDPALGAVPMPHDSLPPVCQPFLGELVEEGLDLGLESGREHAARPFPGDLGERILDGIRLAKRDDAGIVLHGVSLLPGGSGRLRHPPRYAALSTRITQVRP